MAVLVAGLLVLPAAATMAESPIVVNSLSDSDDLTSGSGSCDVSITPGLTCSLRAAIQTANADPAASTITFAIPGTGTKTISPGDQLPTVTSPLVIDGSSQPGSTVNTAAKGSNARLRIVLDGSGVHAGLSATARLQVRGLVVRDFLVGISIGTGATGSLVAGSFIGTAADGMGVAGNQVGIDCICADLTVGGPAAADRNVISGNGEGISVQSAADTRVVIQGNAIGVGADGVTNVGNAGTGVRFEGQGSGRVGGDTVGQANVIAYNGGTGVAILLSPAAPAGVTVARNAIYGNGGLGIDLGDDGVTPNDAAPDADLGPNGLQNAPALTRATTSGGVTRIKGSLTSVPGRRYDLRFYSSPSGETQGRTFLLKKVVFTGTDGRIRFSVTPATAVKVGRVITVTATQRYTKGTSELSVARTVVSP